MTEEELIERRSMPAEEKYQFRLIEWVLGVAAILITSAILWGGASILGLKDSVNDVSSDMKIIKDHIKHADEFHSKVPDGFFTQKRWGLTDELKSQALHEQQIALLDKKIALLDKRMDSHEREAVIWKDLIKDMVKLHSNGTKHK